MLTSQLLGIFVVVSALMSSGADFAPGSNAGQIALIVFNVRGDLVLPLDQRRKIVGRRITRDRKFGARGHQSRYDSKNAEQSRCQHLKPEPRVDVKPEPRVDESYMTILC